MGKQDWKTWGLLILVSLIWGSNFNLIHNGLQFFSPWQLGSLRIMTAGVTLLPYVIYHIRSVKAEVLKFVLLFGILNAGIPHYLFAIAQTVLPPTTTGILNSLPISVGIISSRS